jgi:hypothetical protein
MFKQFYNKKRGRMIRLLSFSIIFIFMHISLVKGDSFDKSLENVTVELHTASSEFVQQEIIHAAFQVHITSWNMVVTGATTNQYDKYGIYVSRSMAVRHPEIYLQADRLFVKAATTHIGFKRAYYLKDVHNIYFNGPEKGGPPITGPPFSFEDVNFTEYRIIEFQAYYPEGYPVFPFLDRRVLPVASTLKPAENQLTQLELGVQYYFSTGRIGSYLIYCDNENTYLFSEGSLFWMKTLEPVGTIQGNPILIFNEHHVWYPLMERDDTGADQTLKNLVQTFTTEITIPFLEEPEKNLLEGLKQVTSLTSDYEKDMAILYSLRPCWGFDEYVQSDSYKNLRRHHADLTDYTLEITSRLYMKHANYLSPITSYLVAAMKTHDEDKMLQKLSAEYVRYAATPEMSYAHGHTWFCDFVEQTVDECYTTRGRHCIVQACNIAAVLDLMDIEYYWLEGYSEAITFIHDWLYLPYYDTIMSNGMITPYSSGTILYHVQKYPLNQLDFVAQKDSWAFFLNLDLRATITPQELIRVLTELEGFHDDDIFILIQTYGEVPLARFIKRLEEQQLALDLIRTGYEAKKKGELYGALQDLFGAYSAFKNLGFTYSDVVDGDTGKTHLDLEKDLVLLCLQVIKKTDNSFREKRYEDALYGFAFVHKYWQPLFSFLALVMDSQEYEEYAEIGTVYTPLKIEETVRSCIKEIKNTAQVLLEQGYERESEEKIEYIIRTLTETEWKYKEDIEALQPEKEEDMILPEERTWNVVWPLVIMLFLISGIGFYLYKKYVSQEKN